MIIWKVTPKLINAKSVIEEDFNLKPLLHAWNAAWNTTSHVMESQMQFATNATMKSKVSNKFYFIG